jgi:hypothetical protein
VAQFVAQSEVRLRGAPGWPVSTEGSRQSSWRLGPAPPQTPRELPSRSRHAWGALEGPCTGSHVHAQHAGAGQARIKRRPRLPCPASRSRIPDRFRPSASRIPRRLPLPGFDHHQAVPLPGTSGAGPDSFGPVRDLQPPGDSYHKARPDVRKMWNRAFFQTIRVRDGAIADFTYEEPFGSLLGSHKGSMVELRGLEPRTCCLQSSRSTT